MSTPHAGPQHAPAPLPAAPGAADHPALALVNTRTARPTGPVDDLADPAAAREWLTTAGLLPSPAALTPAGIERLRSLRECVRALLGARLHHETPDPAALAEVNAVLGATPFGGRLHWEDADAGPRLESLPAAATPLDAALALLARDAAELLDGPQAASVAACGAPDCIRFYLRTHAARQWCSQRCGDRVRAARHYARTRAAEQA
ncbi:CGNR zinc finger domain-containing protein [Kitasatospora sp. NPDC057015]|uniref:CGNR zinc finger domain-containing protein n=1 Tax=Kitasatospora sp. NPDC057015 TaxID=3346001 RepID=UPI003625A317